jgi:hypothetical protein
MTFSRSLKAASRLGACLPFAVPVFASVALSGCDRLREVLYPPNADVVWRGDSALIAARPTVVYRVVRNNNAAHIVPIATGSSAGFEPMLMSDRGWRLFDLRYMQSTALVVPVRGGETLSKVPITRGMWEGSPLDTLRGCNLMPPSALVSLPADVEIVASTERVKPAQVSMLSDDEFQAAITAIPTLIAPSAGVAPSEIGRYARTVHVVPAGATRSPSIVVAYDDPDGLSDSLPPIAQRPRELIVVLDKGVYGYKPTYVYKTVGNRKDKPRRRFLGAFDVDADGKAELFFGLQAPQYALVTYALRYQVDAWHEAFKYERGRCHGWGGP